MFAKLLVGSSAVAFAVLAACSSDTLTPACSISGTYLLHYDLVGGSSPNCKPINDSTSDASDAAATPAGCSVSRDTTACTVNLACKYSVLGYTLNVTGNAKLVNGGASGTGTATAQTTDPKGAVTTCNYNITYTRQ